MTAAVITLGVVAALQTGLCGFLLWLGHDDHRAVVELVDRLARRIQAPQAAVAEAANQVVDPATYAPPALEPDDDEAYWATKDQLASLAAKEELSGGDR